MTHKKYKSVSGFALRNFIGNAAITASNTGDGGVIKHADIPGLLQEGIFIAGTNFKILYANKPFGNICGAGRKKIIGKKLTVLFGGALSERKSNFLNELVSTGRSRMEISSNVKDKVRHARIDCRLYEKGPAGRPLIFGVCIDTTQLKSAIELLDKRNGLLSLFNDVIKYTGRSTDLRDGILYAIGKVCHYTQWEIGHCYLASNGNLSSTGIWNSDIKKKYEWFRHYSENEPYITQVGMPNRCFRSAKTIVKDLSKIGNEFPFERYGKIKKYGLKSGAWIPMKANNKVEGVIEFFSGSKISPNDETMGVINNICLEIGSMKERIESYETIKSTEKLAALGRFSAGIAHEIRNPLANISALSQLLLKKEDAAEKKQHLSHIIENTIIANKIITDLLNFVSAGGIRVKKADVKKFLSGIIEKTTPRFIERNIRIRCNIEPDLPHLYIDETKLENAIMNFISNSIDAMPAGGNITVEAIKRKKEKFVTIYISDNGSGISAENLNKIFEPFFTTKSEGTGLGMGLALGVIKSHEGTLSVKSKPNAGTSIEIKLPLRKAKPYE